MKKKKTVSPDIMLLISNQVVPNFIYISHRKFKVPRTLMLTNFFFQSYLNFITRLPTILNHQNRNKEVVAKYLIQM